MNLRFTRYKKEYFEQSANLMSQTWHFNEDLENPRDESLVFKAYFQHSLLESTYKDFLVDKNGRVPWQKRCAGNWTHPLKIFG